MQTQHNYNCKASKWEDSGNFIESMKTDLKDELALVTNVRTAAWWDAYVDAKPVWMAFATAILVTAFFGWLVGKLAFKVRGAYFVVITIDS